MKYTVEVKKNEVIETLEIKNKKYTKNTKLNGKGILISTSDFSEQLQKQHYEKYITDRIYTVIDSEYLPTELLDLFDEMEAYTNDK